MLTIQSVKNNPPQTDQNWNVIEILSAFESLYFQKGEKIMEQWQQENNVYFVVKGTVLVWEYDMPTEKEAITEIHTNGNFINLEILTGESGTHRYAVAKSEVEVKSIPMIALMNLTLNSPFLSKYLLQYSLSKQQDWRKRLLRFAMMNTRQRIIHFLVEYVEKLGRTVGFERVVNHVLTHQELASFSHTSRQSVTTLLNELRNQKLIHFNRRYLLVRDMNSLKKIASSSSTINGETGHTEPAPCNH